MATALEESYSRITGTPINASGGGRPGGDQIAISFAKGKKSTKEELDELAILKAKDELARLSLLPVGSEQQKYDWAAANQRLAEEEAVRSAAQAAIDLQQRQQALNTSQIMDPLDALAQTTSIQGQLASMQAQELAMREKRALLPGELAAQQASLASTNQSIAQSRQSMAHASALNPLEVKSREMELAHSAKANPLDIQAKQVGIQGAQQQINTQAWDNYYRDMAYKEAHLGMNPAQMASTVQFSAQRKNATGGAPVGSAVDDAYMKSIHGNAYQTTQEKLGLQGVRYTPPPKPVLISPAPTSQEAWSAASRSAAYAAGKNPWR